MKTDFKPAAPANRGSTNLMSGPRRPLLWTVIILAVILAALFRQGLIPGFVVFSNDGPIGAMVAEQNRMPSILKGLWVNQNWFGSESISPPPSISSALRLVTSPFVYAKVLCPFSVLIAGLGACFCFRRLKLSPWACVLGGLAAALNSDFFSTSCWGVSTQVIGLGMMYFAVGFLADPSAKWSWIRVILGGMAVGVGVMEAYDIGALNSLFVAAFVVYQALFLTEKTDRLPENIGLGIMRTGVVAVFAGLIALHSLTGLIGTQIKGVAGAQQDEQTKAARWAEATQWSVPKAEILQVFVPGVFGYRNIWHMYENDQPTDDQYWGTIGAGGGLWRLVGTGFYAGVFVVLIVVWTMLQSFRGRGSPFTLLQRRAIWFWSGAMIVAALMAFGKNAPFYQLFYALPYASTIRNPQKFMHVFSWALIIVFAYGVHGLVAAYMENPVARVNGVLAQFKNWRAKAESFDRKWIAGCVWAVVVSIVGWLMYAAQSSKLEAYIATVGIDAKDAPGIASFSVHAVGWFILFLVLSSGLLALIFSGQFSGPRARWGAVLIGAMLLVDLGRADAPWIVYWDTNYKYKTDSIIDFLAEKPYEHRVTLLPIQAGNQQLALLNNAYYSAWKQHLFPYHNIQCLDDIQEPRVAVEKRTFQMALPPNNNFNVFRLWELSNTRYILGPGGDFVKQIDPSGKQFRVIKSFNLVPKRPNPSTWAEDYSAVEDPNGALALLEFASALPRAKLYSQWQVSTNDDTTLQALASPSFDVHQSVLVANAIPAADPANAGKDPGTVEIKPNYKSKRIEFEADAKVPSVLLLAERYSPKWQAEVDGQPATLLRCNFITRGVYLTPGHHTVVMRYVSSVKTFWISAGMIALGMLLWGFLALNPGPETPVAAAAPEKASEDKPKA